jgi:hypothetical protein
MTFLESTHTDDSQPDSTPETVGRNRQLPFAVDSGLGKPVIAEHRLAEQQQLGRHLHLQVVHC